MHARIVVADQSEARFYALRGRESGLRLPRRLTDAAAHLRNRDTFRGTTCIKQSIRIHGVEVPVRAEVGQLTTFSAHADADELLAWMRQLSVPPRRTFVTHGEPHASDVLRYRIQHEIGWNVRVPEYREVVNLDEP